MQISQTTVAPLKARWSAVFSLFLGVTCLISAEFTPVSLLTPLSRGLGISEGMAGQTVTAVGAGEATITATAAVAAEGGEKPSASCTGAPS